MSPMDTLLALLSTKSQLGNVNNVDLAAGPPGVIFVIVYCPENETQFI